MAYVLGFFAADGCMMKNKRGACFIEFQITDEDLLEGIRDVIGSDNKISSRKRAENFKRIYRLQIGSRQIYEDLLALGFTPHKSKTLKFPLVPEEYAGNFIRGYFDGDGNVSFARYFRKDRGVFRHVLTSRFTSGSKRFLLALNEKLKGVVKGGYIYRKERGFELVFAGKDSLALFDFMYNNGQCRLWLDRKKKIFERAIKTMDLRA